MKHTPCFLIVEDSKIDLEFVVRWLDRFNAELVCCADVPCSIRNSDRKFDAVFVNLNLGGDPLAGLKVIQHYRSVCGDVPIWVVTGAEDEKMRVLAMQSGATGFFSKDYDHTDTLAIERTLNMRWAALRNCKSARWKDPKTWGYGLAAATIGGGATSAKAWMATLVAHQFTDKVPVLDLYALWAVFIAGAATNVFSYLHKSPLPGISRSSESGETSEFRRDDDGWKYKP